VGDIITSSAIITLLLLCESSFLFPLVLLRGCGTVLCRGSALNAKWFGFGSQSEAEVRDTETLVTTDVFAGDD
jgi:hypothetical protein